MSYREKFVSNNYALLKCSQPQRRYTRCRSRHCAGELLFQRYVKTGLFDVKYAKYIRDAFQVRNTADYSDFYIVAKSDAELQYEHAVELTEAVKIFLETHENDT